MKDLGKKYNLAKDTFNDFPEEDQKFLHTFSFICMLSFDIWVKKTIIESIVDQGTATQASDNGKSKKKKED